jgi:serine/threonine protein kinase
LPVTYLRFSIERSIFHVRRRAVVVGQTISHYKVLEKIGEGGMGEVYLAEDTSLEPKVALKFLPGSLQTDLVAHKSFAREAKSAAAIEYPSIYSIKAVAQTLKEEGHRGSEAEG